MCNLRHRCNENDINDCWKIYWKKKQAPFQQQLCPTSPKSLRLTGKKKRPGSINMCVTKKCEFHKDAAPLPHEEGISGMRPNHPGFDHDLDLSSILKHLNRTSLLRSCGTPNVHWVSDAHPRAHRRLTEKAKEGFRFKISSQWRISLVRHHSAVFFPCFSVAGICFADPSPFASLSGLAAAAGTIPRGVRRWVEGPVE